jgi:hypothetical protein
VAAPAAEIRVVVLTPDASAAVLVGIDGIIARAAVLGMPLQIDAFAIAAHLTLAALEGEI